MYAFIKKSIIQFLLSFILIIIINFALIGTLVLKINNGQNTLSLVEQIDHQIHYINKQFIISESGRDLIKQHHLWVQIIDKNQGTELFNINKPHNIANKYNYADTLQFSKYYLQDYPIFSKINDNYITLIAFPKDKIVRYQHNYLNLPTIKLIPWFVLIILIINCFYFGFLYFYSTRRISKHLTPLVNAIDKLPHGLQTPITSIDELNHLTTAITHTDGLLKKNAYFKEQWINAIAHDIKTPLSVIISHADLAKTLNPHHQIAQHMSHILNESYYIQNVLNDLNIFARITNNNFILRKKSINIVTFIKEMMIDILNQEIWTNVTFDFQHQLNPNSQLIEIDEALMSRVIHNLLYNSVLHNKQQCNISISIKKINTTIQIIIKDDGKGVTHSQLLTLNQINFIDLSSIRQGGLGLKIVKQIIELHQGSFTIDSQPHQYFKNTIILPL